ncbi:MAG TPA: prepilin-type N-terminal cleavage/methylation domain-containing protein [Actinomycetota bacterium]|nr:prepilin-type N-terminal cleavage/methylation domain-containing protein [Actinomycetota bacterium]
MSAFRSRRREGGFTLVEMLSSMLVFSVVTIGVVPLLALSMQTTLGARGQTAGRNVVREVMEHVRGIEYFVSYDAKPDPDKRVDLMDLYYPRIAGNGTMLSGQSYAVGANPPIVGSGGIFTTECPAPVASPGNPACPEVPPGYEITIKASFVKHIAGTSPQTYSIVTPKPTYRYDTSAGGNEPPADLMDISVKGTWTTAGRDQSFELRSLIGDRKFIPVSAADAGPSPTPGPSAPAATDLSVEGTAESDYLMQLSTGFSTSTMPTYANHGCLATPCESELTITQGVASSKIRAGDYVSADQDTRWGVARIVRTYDGAPPASPPPDLKLVEGAVGIAHAPPNTITPDSRVPSSATATPQPVANPDLGTASIAHLVRSTTSLVQADVTGGLPRASGLYFGDTNALNQIMFHNTQTDFAAWKLTNQTTNPLIRMNIASISDQDRSRGSTSSRAYALTEPTGRRVESTVDQSHHQWGILRINFGGSPYLLSLSDFVSDVTCISTANPTTASASASWSLSNFSYRYDPNNNGQIPSTLTTATFSAGIPPQLNGTPGTDPLQAVKATNPLVWDGSNNCVASNCDIFLFEERDASGGLTKRGYLSNWSTNKNLSTYESPDGRVTRASIDGAIRIDVAPLAVRGTTPIPESSINIAIGKSSCEAVDNR